MRDTIDMAREAGVYKDCDWRYGMKDDGDSLKAFEALVRADEREETNRRANASWTLMCEKMVAAERKACAKVCEERGWHVTAAAIRARGNT
jgi:hypothetical protein